jgi:thioredoxin-like negative regulator of GroEL
MSSAAEIEELTSLGALKRRLRDGRPLLLDVFGEPCIGCTTPAALQTIAKAIAGRAVLVRMSADRVPELGAEYRLQMIPALLLFVPPAKRLKYPSTPDASGLKVADWVLENLPAEPPIAPKAPATRRRRAAAA